jgi:hypothetical protein
MLLRVIKITKVPTFTRRAFDGFTSVVQRVLHAFWGVRGYLRPRNVLSNVVLALNGPTTLF